MYRALTTYDLSQAQTLWEHSFDDPSSFVDWYFSQRFSPQQTRGIFQGVQLQAMGQLVPYRLAWHGSSLPITYLVGLCTQASLRGQGLATDLLRTMLMELYEEDQCLNLLIPAVPDFYKDRGWSHVFFHRLDTIAPQTNEAHQGILSPGSFNDIEQLISWYSRYFSQARVFLLRRAQDWKDLLHDHLMDGGKLWLYRHSPEKPMGYLLVRRLPDYLLIREMAFPHAEDGHAALALLRKEYPQTPIKWQAWPGQPVSEDTINSINTPFAMARIVSFPRFIQKIPFNPVLSASFEFRLSDPLLEPNNGYFRLQIHHGRGELENIPPSDSLPLTPIQQWAAWSFGLLQDTPDSLRQCFPHFVPYFNDLF